MPAAKTLQNSYNKNTHCNRWFGQDAGPYARHLSWYIPGWQIVGFMTSRKTRQNLTLVRAAKGHILASCQSSLNNIHQIRPHTSTSVYTPTPTLRPIPPPSTLAWNTSRFFQQSVMITGRSPERLCRVAACRLERPQNSRSTSEGGSKNSTARFEPVGVA